MSFSRWSLPSKAVGRQKSTDAGPDQQVKFPTVNFSQPRLRRRGKISSVFAETSGNSLESSTNNSNSRIHQSAKKSLEIHPLINTTNTTHEHEPSDLTIPLRSPRRPSVFAGTRNLSPFLLVPNESRTSAADDPPARTRVADPFADNPATLVPKNRGLFVTDNSIIAPRRVRSVSSSYPSEGMRSPVAGTFSPEPSSITRKLVTDLTCLGSLPNRNLYASLPASRQSSFEMEELPAASLLSGINSQNAKMSAAVVHSDTPSDETSLDRAAVNPMSPFADQKGESRITSLSSADNITHHESLPHCGASAMRTADESRIPRWQFSSPLPETDPSTASDNESRESLELCSMKRRNNTAAWTRSIFPQIANDSIDANMHDPGASLQGLPPRSAKNSQSSYLSTEALPGSVTSQDRNKKSPSITTRGAHKFRFAKWMRRLCRRTRTRFGNKFQRRVGEPSFKVVPRRRARSIR